MLEHMLYLVAVSVHEWCGYLTEYAAKYVIGVLILALSVHYQAHLVRLTNWLRIMWDKTRNYQISS